MVCFYVAASLLLNPRNVDLRSKFEAADLPIYSQKGPLCWAYTINTLAEYELAVSQHQTTRLSVGYLEWASRRTDAEGSEGSNFGRAYRAFNRYGAAPLLLGGEPSADGVGQDASLDVQNAAKGVGRFDVDWIRFWSDTKRVSDSEFESLKTHISGGHPVAIGLRWPKRLAFAAGSYVMQVPEAADVFDGHCVALIGFKDDASIPGGGAFLFRNSWGTKWGDHGYAWMPYELVRQYANDLVAIRYVPSVDKSLGEPITLQTKDLPRASKGTTRVQDMEKFGSAWAGGKQVLLQAAQAGDSITFRFKVKKNATYQVMLGITRAMDYGTFDVRMDGQKPAPEAKGIDGVGPGVWHAAPIQAGVYRLKPGEHSITLTVSGKSSASVGYLLGLDTITLTPVTTQSK